MLNISKSMAVQMLKKHVPGTILRNINRRPSTTEGKVSPKQAGATLGFWGTAQAMEENGVETTVFGEKLKNGVETAVNTAM